MNVPVDEAAPTGRHADDGAAVRAIDALLPQTQCTRCGFAGCLPYAQAIHQGDADINQCPPGGEVTIAALASLLGVELKALNPANGTEAQPTRAWIDEEVCIGCAKCLPACPVDAIVGAHRFMHTVITAECNGCELCLGPCPVDCIHMAPALDAGGEPLPHPSWMTLRREADHYRERYEAHNARRERDRRAREDMLAARKQKAAGWRSAECDT